MPVVQDAFYVPEWIEEKLLTGEFIRYGSVVRKAVGSDKGQIVKHLKPLKKIEEEQVENVGKAVLKFAKNNKKVLVITGVVIGTATLCGTIYHKISSGKQKPVKEFKNVLKEYIIVVREGKMNVDTIDKLAKSWNELKQYKDFDNIKWSTKEVNAIVNLIHDYTLKLAKDNLVELNDEEKNISGNMIIDFPKYLEAQKRIFEEVA